MDKDYERRRNMGKIIFGFVVSMCCIRGFADEITNIEQCMNTNLTADVLSRFPSNPTSSVQSCVLTFVKGSVIGDMRLFASSFSAASRFSEFGIADLDDIPATISKGFFNLMTSVSNCTSKVMSYNEMTNNGVVKATISLHRHGIGYNRSEVSHLDIVQTNSFWHIMNWDVEE